MGRGTVWGQFGTSERLRECFKAVTLLGINHCTYCTRAIKSLFSIAAIDALCKTDKPSEESCSSRADATRQVLFFKGSCAVVFNVNKLEVCWEARNSRLLIPKFCRAAGLLTEKAIFHFENTGFLSLYGIRRMLMASVSWHVGCLIQTWSIANGTHNMTLPLASQHFDTSLLFLFGLLRFLKCNWTLHPSEEWERFPASCFWSVSYATGRIMFCTHLQCLHGDLIRELSSVLKEAAWCHIHGYFSGEDLALVFLGKRPGKMRIFEVGRAECKLESVKGMVFVWCCSFRKWASRGDGWDAAQQYRTEAVTCSSKSSFLPVYTCGMGKQH